jgi:hypothetical protein
MGISTSIIGPNLTIEEGDGFLEKHCKGCIVRPTCHKMCERVENKFMDMISNPKYEIHFVNNYGDFIVCSSFPSRSGRIVIKKKSAFKIFRDFKKVLARGNKIVGVEGMIKPKNLNEPTIVVRHSELKRFGDSIYKSECPKCGGVMLMGRDSKTFVLQEFDRCVLCGQSYCYVDINDLRKAEGLTG